MKIKKIPAGEILRLAATLLSFVAAALIVYITWLMVAHTNLNFDEGYNLQIPLNLIHYGIYGSHTLRGFVSFDPYVSSGPIFLLPVVPVIWFLGLSVVRVRIVALIYLVILIFFLYLINRRLFGHFAALLGVISLFSVQTFLIRSSTLVGDSAGIGLVIAGMYAWALVEEKQRPIYAILSGILLGLAVWAKFSMIVAVAIVIVTLVFAFIVNKRRSQYHLLGITAGIALTIGIAWFLFSIFITWKTGSLISGPASDLVKGQFNFDISHNFNNGLPMLLKTIGLAGAAAAAYNIISFFKRRVDSRTASLAVNVVPLVWIIWWLLFNRYSVDRHLFPGLVFAIIPLTQFFMTATHNWHQHGLKLVIAIFFIVGTIPAVSETATYVSQLEQKNIVKVDQALMVHYISKLSPDIQVMGWGWYMDWDVASLSNRPFGDLSTRTSVSPSDNIHLVITPTLIGMGLYNSVLLPMVKECSGKLVYKAGTYEMYSIIGPCTLN